MTVKCDMFGETDPKLTIDYPCEGCPDSKLCLVEITRRIFYGDNDT